jgi:putative sigma-54 modulation protein
MKVHVRCLPAHSPALAEHTTRKIHQHLSRFAHRLRNVEARLSDVNGPRGGCDKRCLLVARGPGLGLLRVEELHEDFYVGVDRALVRLEQAVGRSIARVRERHAMVEGRTS